MSGGIATSTTLEPFEFNRTAYTPPNWKL